MGDPGEFEGQKLRAGYSNPSRTHYGAQFENETFLNPKSLYRLSYGLPLKMVPTRVASRVAIAITLRVHVPQ